MSDLYEISIPGHRKRTAKILNENVAAYDSLSDACKKSDYGRQIKALQDLHRAAYMIYRNAPNVLPAPSDIER